MKRAPFLGAGAAVILSGCGGHVMRALPGVAPSSLVNKPSSKARRLVPEFAENIPDNVLAHPIVGEAWRFDGAVAPAGWILAQGQTVNIADSRPLFSILKTIAGGDGKTTFKLPNPGFGMIVAAGGSWPGSAAVFAQTLRHITYKDSLGAGALAAMPRQPKAVSAATTAERKLAASSIRPGRSAPVPVSAELAARMRDAHADARTAAIDRLNPSNRTRLEAAVQAAVEGRGSVVDSVRAMASSLTAGEAEALLRVNDAMIRPFNDLWRGSPRESMQIDAAAFLFSVAITREQDRAMFERERSLERR